MLPWPIAMRGAAAAFGQQIAQAFAPADQLDRPQQRRRRRRTSATARRAAALDALHRKGDRAAGADRVDAELVAALRRAQHGVADRRRRTASRARTGSRTPARTPPSPMQRRCARSRSCRRRSWPACCARVDAQLLGREARRLARTCRCWKLRVGSAPKRLNASKFVAVPSSRYLAVAGPNDRFDRSRLSSISSADAPTRPRWRAAHRDGLDVLAAEHRAAAAAAGMPAVVRDRGVAHRALAGRADRGDLIVGAEPLAQCRPRWPGKSSPAQRRRPARAAPRRRRSRAPTARGARPTITIASQPQRLPASAKPLLASESLMRSVSGLLLTTANLADVVSGLPTSGLNTKTSGAAGRQRIGGRAAFVEQQPRAQTAAAEELPQHARSSGTRSAGAVGETSTRR